MRQFPALQGDPSRSSRAPLDRSGRHRTGDRANGRGRARPRRRATLSEKRRKVISKPWRCSTRCPNRPRATFANSNSGNQSLDASGDDGYAAPETVDASECVAALAEKSGNLTQLVNSLVIEMFHRLRHGRFVRRRRACRPVAGACPSRRQSSHSCERAYVSNWRRALQPGDLAGAEHHFTTGLKFFDDPGFRQLLRRRRRTFANCEPGMRGCSVAADAARERYGPDDGGRRMRTIRTTSRSRGIMRRSPALDGRI